MLETLYKQALALYRGGQPDAAEQCLTSLLNQHGQHEGALHLQAILCYESKRIEQATVYFRQLLQCQPSHEQTRLALGHCLMQYGNQAHAQGQFKQADLCFSEALSLQPTDVMDKAALHYNLANAKRELGLPKEAAQHYQAALQYDPNDADTHNNLGNVQRELGQLDLAISSYQRALLLNPQLHHAKVHLVHQKQHVCDWQGLPEQIVEIRHTLATQAQAQISPFAFLAMPGTTASEQMRCADQWVAQRYGRLIEKNRQNPFKQQQTQERSGTLKRKLKIGYLSADFRLHPLAFLITELIGQHDRAAYEIHAYSYGKNDQSNARARLKKAFDQFHDIQHLSETDAANTIHQHGIDILVDLSGFTQTSRSGIVALKPATVHINWLGFPGTMGHVSSPVEAKRPLFDCLISDAFITPADSAQDYAEKLVLLPCYQANDSLRPVAKPPSRAGCQLPEDAFVYCCFNQTFKITPEVFAVWMRLLKAQANSVLWLLECNPWAKENLIKAALAHGVAANKLVFAPRLSIAEHLARHVHAELFLDTLPYNAHTTCSDALWMGLPVLSCVGQTFSSRVAGSLLQTVGLTEMITYNLADYENRARYYTEHPDALQQLKQKLVEQRASSPLFNPGSFARALERCYQTVWQELITKRI
ncbi:MAG: tetratricopeptide repeat protein [Methylotenera sp.]|nr:tetratricopeptide repeat protein [Methylotenera sp.]